MLSKTSSGHNHALQAVAILVGLLSAVKILPSHSNKISRGVGRFMLKPSTGRDRASGARSSGQDLVMTPGISETKIIVLNPQHYSQHYRHFSIQIKFPQQKQLNSLKQHKDLIVPITVFVAIKQPSSIFIYFYS